MALLGKISAVLSANTQDFTRNLGTAKKELSDFAKRVRGIELNINTRALDGTLTKLQKFQRTVQEIANLQVKGIDLGLDPRKLEDQFRVFEDIGKPLTKLVGQIEGLSTNLQAGLYPALGEVQRGFQDIYRAIQNGEPLSNFTRKIDDLRGRLVSLGRVTAASADLGKLVQSLDADNVGASFAQPFAKSALQRSLELRGQAEKTPASARQDGLFADLAAEAERGAVRIERAAAKVFEIQLRIANGGPTTGRKEALASAQQQLNAFVRLQEGINRRLQTELRSVQIKDIISPQAATAADDLIKKLSTAVQTLRAVGGSSFEPLIAGAGKVAEQFIRGEASASRLAKAIGAINAASNSLGTGKGLLERTNSLLFSGTERERQRIQRDADRQRSRTDDPDRRQRIDRLRDTQLSRLTLNEEIIPELKSLQGQAAGLGSPELKKQADDLLASSRQISNALKAAESSAEKGSLKESNAAYEKANRLLAEQGKRYRELARDIQITNDARRQQDLFLQASGGRGEQLSQGARDAAADVSVARQFRGQIADGASRISIDTEINRVSGSVTALQQKIAEVASSKLGAAEKVAELDRLDNEIRQATKGLAQFVAQLSGGAFNTKQIEKAMAMARNTAGSISVRNAAVAQLAFQQALFAVDDLISSTGGLEYKLRAVGNNITQLGLLLGQSGVIPGLSATTGLFIGLSTVLAGQALSAILRWATGAEEADARGKALNDTLSRQKTLAESLQQAFESLGDSIARKAFSEPAQEARAFRKEIEEIAKKQRELRESRVASLDANVQKERAAQSDLQKKLDNSNDPGQRVSLTRQIEEARARERAAASAAVQRRVTGGDVAARLRGVADREMATPSGETSGRNEQIRRRLARDLASVDTGTSVEAVRSQRAAIEREIARLSPAGGQGGGFIPGGGVGGQAARDVADLQATLNSLELPLIEAIDNLAISVETASQSAAVAIESAQKDVASAIQRGVVGAAAFQAALDNTANQLSDAQSQLRDAQSIANTEDRERAVRQAQGRVNDIQLRQDAIAEAAREMRLGQTFGGERTTRALSSLEGNERLQNEFGRLTAQVAAAADAEFAARTKLEAAQKSGNDAAAAQAAAELEAAQRAGEVAALLAEAAIAMEGAVGRIRRVVEGALSGSESIADDAQRNFNERPTDANRRARDEAEQQLIRDREQAARAQNAIDRRRSEATSDPAVRAINDELSAIDQERKRLAAQAKIDGTVVDPADSERLANREAELFAERERRLFALTEAERASADALAQEQAARRRVIEELDRERQALEEIESRRNPRGDAVRGLDLVETPAKRAGRELRQGLADIDAAIKAREDAILEQIAPGGIPGRDATQAERDQLNALDAERKDARNRMREDRMRAEAPLMTGMADAVRNAVLQGPSRAALNASDATTAQGQQELNRLLRGDDPARNQDLVALQREANRLLEIIADNDQPVAN
jgi:hypothetical protein